MEVCNTRGAGRNDINGEKGYMGRTGINGKKGKGVGGKNWSSKLSITAPKTFSLKLNISRRPRAGTCCHTDRASPLGRNHKMTSGGFTTSKSFEFDTEEKDSKQFVFF